MNDQAEDIYQIFQDHGELLHQVRTIAMDVSRLIEDLSPLIEAHSSVVCPECSDVCCRNRHSYHDRSDMIYMASLGIRANNSGPAGDIDPCRFISASGCTLSRSERPFRCSWFFCAHLLEHMSSGMSRRQYRDFTERLTEITSRRMEMIRSYEAVLPYSAVAGPKTVKN